MHLVRDSYGRKPNKSIAAKSSPDSLLSKGIFGTSGRGLSGTNSNNPFSSSNIQRYVQEEIDLVSRLNQRSTDDSKTIDKTTYTNVDFDTAAYDDKNFNPDDYLNL